MFLFLSVFLATAKPLPLIDVPPSRGSSDTLVVIVSGDGGWAKIDKSISGVLANEGMPVVGLNALQYFWTKRTPEVAAHDLGTIIDSGLARWKKQHVILVGYSRGADVLPAMVARLTPEQQSKIRLLTLLAPSPRVEFEFHVVDWMHDSKKGLAVQPELAKLTLMKTLCVWGDDDTDSLCRGLALPHVKVVTLHGSHHFDGDYAKLARIILEALN
jgi:type IV secretory pathway VirJ component